MCRFPQSRSDRELVLKPETLPALNRMRPFTNLQLAQALCVARVLADYDAVCIPDELRFLVRRPAVVVNAAV